MMPTTSPGAHRRGRRGRRRGSRRRQTVRSSVTQDRWARSVTVGVGGRRAVSAGAVAGAGPGGAEAGGRALEEHRAEDVGPLEQLGGRARGSGPRPSRGTRRVSATCRATLTDCSTSTTVVPGRARRRDEREQLGDDVGRQAERQLVDEQQPRRADERHGEGQHLLLAAGQVAGGGVGPLPRGWGTARGPLDPAAASPRPGPGRATPPSAGSRRRSGSGTRPGPPGTWADAEGGDLVRRRVRRLPAVEEHDAAVGLDDPARWPCSSVDLPAPFVPRRATHSPSATSRSTPKSTCTPL